MPRGNQIMTNPNRVNLGNTMPNNPMNPIVSIFIPEICIPIKLGKIRKNVKYLLDASSLY